jgi:hypothetical protein
MQMLRAARLSYRGFFMKGDGRVFVSEESAKAGPYGVCAPVCLLLSGLGLRPHRQTRSATGCKPARKPAV